MLLAMGFVARSMQMTFIVFAILALLYALVLIFQLKDKIFKSRAVK